MYIIINIYIYTYIYICGHIYGPDQKCLMLRVGLFDQKPIVHVADCAKQNSVLGNRQAKLCSSLIFPQSIAAEIHHSCFYKTYKPWKKKRFKFSPRPFRCRPFRFCVDSFFFTRSWAFSGHCDGSGQG